MQVILVIELLQFRTPSLRKEIWSPLVVKGSKSMLLDSSSGTVDRNPLASAGTQVWSLVRELKSHVPPEQLGLCATTTEACVPHSLCSATRGATTGRSCAPDREQPLLTTARESLHAATKTQCNEVNKCIVLKRNKERNLCFHCRGAGSILGGS